MAIPSLVATISQADQSRLAELGVEPEKSVVIGSPKFDSLIGQARATLASLPQKTQSELSGRDHWDSQATSLASAISLMAAPASGPNPLILAGSTHPGEEELIMEAVMALPAPGASLAIAPRHLVRIPEVSRLVESFTLKPSPYSETGTLRPGPGSVTIVDTMGNLSGLYRECDLAIVGGSFFNGDGHNPLEPAAFGKPIVFGQSMSSFKGPAEKLESIGAATVAPRAFLATAIASLLASPEKASRAGLAGLWLLSRQRPVAPILAQGILEFLSEPAPQGSQKAMAYLRSQALVQGGPGLYP
jgi:3-deoxy-D-manno-octulosonic-acid transferase